LDCASHPGVAATGICSRCFRGCCPSCLTIASDGRYFCVNCVVIGRNPPAIADGSSIGPLAIVSMVLSLVGISGICCFPGIAMAISGSVMGIVELGRIRKGQSPAGGRGFAIAGCIIGAVTVFLYTLFIVFMLGITFIGAI